MTWGIKIVEIIVFFPFFFGICPYYVGAIAVRNKQHSNIKLDWNRYIDTRDFWGRYKNSANGNNSNNKRGQTINRKEEQTRTQIQTQIRKISCHVNVRAHSHWNHNSKQKSKHQKNDNIIYQVINETNCFVFRSQHVANTKNQCVNSVNTQRVFASH